MPKCWPARARGADRGLQRHHHPQPPAASRQRRHMAHPARARARHGYRGPVERIAAGQLGDAATLGLVLKRNPGRGSQLPAVTAVVGDRSAGFALRRAIATVEWKAMLWARPVIDQLKDVFVCGTPRPAQDVLAVVQTRVTCSPCWKASSRWRSSRPGRRRAGRARSQRRRHRRAGRRLRFRFRANTIA